jgi:hypothetical protein
MVAFRRAEMGVAGGVLHLVQWCPAVERQIDERGCGSSAQQEARMCYPIPASRALRIASARSATCSLLKMLEM